MRRAAKVGEQANALFRLPIGLRPGMLDGRTSSLGSVGGRALGTYAFSNAIHAIL
jgi:hypothetical protein